MSNSIVFSIIIPVYNAGKWIAQTIASMQEQTEKNIEIICIDDCSTDNSAEIIEKIALTDPRVHLIRNYSNSGPGKSRNIGLRLAKGEFIHFFDADDYLCNQNFYREAYQLMVDHCLDMLIFDNFEYDETKKTLVTEDKRRTPFYYAKTELNHVLNPKEIDFRRFNLNPFPPSKIFRKSFLVLNQIFFPEGMFWEDTPFSVEISLCMKRVLITNKKYWVYRVNVATSTSSNFDNKAKDIVPMHKMICKALIKKNLYEQYKIRFLLICYASLVRFYLPKIQDDDIALSLNGDIKRFFRDLEISKSELKNVATKDPVAAEVIQFYLENNCASDACLIHIRKFPIFKVLSTKKEKRLYLFNRLPFYKIVYRNSCSYHYLLGIFIFSVSSSVIKLCGRLPILQITYLIKR